jgi:hypothetical protein
MTVKTATLRNAKASKLTALGSPGALWRSSLATPLHARGALVVAAVSLLGFVSASGASAAGTVGWTIRGVAEPSNFSANDALNCGLGTEQKCDSYQLLATNVGDEASKGTITLTDNLPPGIKPLEVKSGHINRETGTEWGCAQSEGSEEVWTVTCEFAESVPAGRYAPWLDIVVSAPSVSMSGPLKNEVSITGGGAAAVVSASEKTLISSQAPPFGISEFDMESNRAGGAPALGAEAHPWEITTSFEIPSIFDPPGAENTFQSVKSLKSVVVELPAGFAGNPQAIPRCTQTVLEANKCPAGSLVGTFAILGGGISGGEFGFTGSEGLSASEGACCSAIYNMVPEGGYPAQFGLKYAGVPVYLYASVVRSGSGYHLRVTTPGIPTVLETSYAAITFFGDPEKLDGVSSEAAFLTNPANCSAEAFSSRTSRIELASWEEPGNPQAKETTVYPQLTRCDLLQFNPSLTLAPSATGEEGGTQADAPSAYTTDLTVPQTSKFSELATPELKDATVTLPEGVSVSPSAGQGLAGCQATGPEGINIGSANIGPGSQDLGDPEATELGAGHAGGNNSPYDDGFYHTAKGHCPQASTLGTVEVFTPLLPSRCGGEGQAACQPGESPAPLQGHVFLAQPGCSPCSDAQAEKGEVFGLYLEVEGDGVIVKIPGSVAANPSTGQLTASFRENPQLPFEDLKLHFHGGPRAPLANPQACGSFATTSTLTSWGGQSVSQSSKAYGIDWNGVGGACPATLPFAPGFTAGTTTPVAGAFSPFALTFSRNDREQDLSGLSVTLPPGLLGKIAGVLLCDEAQANAGTCSPESQIGTTSVLTGPGEHPLYVPGGRVYLTTGYKGGPFGLSIVVPAVAGPFNLGNVVVRASIHIDPNTAQVTVVSDPLPQSKDGVPFRLRTVNVEIDRQGGFTFNPTNCAQQQITATIAGAQGATARVTSPFAVTGCASLPFKPSFTASTQGKTSKANGASLTVRVAQKPGEANIHKVSLQLPLILPARLTTLQKACTEAQFNANPAGCPSASVIGTATAVTPVLNVPLSGPAYLVSHGGAAFPDVEFVLQGQGVTIVLDGKTDIKKGITYSRFETVPDAPISTFETNLPEGPHSALTANGNLCSQTRTITVRKRVTRRVHGRLRHVSRTVKKVVSQPLSMPTTITGQNGAQVTQTTKIAVTGCPRAKAVKHRQVKKKSGGHRGKGRRKR